MDSLQGTWGKWWFWRFGFWSRKWFFSNGEFGNSRVFLGVMLASWLAMMESWDESNGWQGRAWSFGKLLLRCQGKVNGWFAASKFWMSSLMLVGVCWLCWQGKWWKCCVWMMKTCCRARLGLKTENGNGQKQLGGLRDCMKLVRFCWLCWRVGFEEAKQGWTGLWQSCHFDVFFDSKRNAKQGCMQLVMC